MDDLVSNNRINFDKRNLELDFTSADAPYDRILNIKGKKFYVQSGYLVIWSEYFDTLFNNAGFSEAHQGEVVIDDVLPEHFEMFLKFIYPCQLEITADNYYILLSLAHRFMATRILDKCHEFIAANYDRLDKLQLLETAFTHNIEEIKEDIARVLASYSGKVIQCKCKEKQMKQRSFDVKSENNYVNCIPGVSQLKSLILLIWNMDATAAIRVQQDFAFSLPLLSQFISLCNLYEGDTRNAFLVQKDCAHYISLFLNAVPVVGIVKGAVHHFIGDHVGGDLALYASTRTSMGLMGRACGGKFGKYHALLGFILGGFAVDILATALKSHICKKYTPVGICAKVDELKKSPSIECMFDTLVEHFSSYGIKGPVGFYMGAALTVRNPSIEGMVDSVRQLFPVTGILGYLRNMLLDEVSCIFNILSNHWSRYTGEINIRPY